LEFARESDILVVTKLDRLARSVQDLMVILQTLESKRVGVRNGAARIATSGDMLKS
jgi:DNA invertase Pin-like site-specific DNA recombinase